MNKKKRFKPIMALLMAIITLMGYTPTTVLADGKDFDVRNIHIDGEQVPIDDERILNTVSVAPSRLRSNTPYVSDILALSADFARNPNVSMAGTTLSAIRYVAIVDGIEYEAFCADPLLRGPENSAAIYALSGEANASLKNAMENGYPTNSEWSNISVDTEDRLWWTYITRVAVAMANNPSRNFSGNTTAIEQATALANGTTKANNVDYPAIMVNGKQSDSDTGRNIEGAAAQSQSFSVTYNRKSNSAYNPFTFQWAVGTPDGAKLVVDGTVIATAPTNSDRIFRDDITAFYIEMPNNALYENKTAAVNLVGIHNQYADKIWLMQNPNDPSGWQDIVFYIPEMTASASFSFTSEVDDEIETPGPEPTPTPTPTPSSNSTAVKIQKIDALTRENIPGALMRLRGISSAQVITEDGQIKEIDNTGINLSQVLTAGATTGSGDVKSTVTNGVWTLEGLPYGAYVVEEERAPENYSLLPQHTSYSFWILPGNVKIFLNQEESTIYVDDVWLTVHEAFNAAIAGIDYNQDARALAAELQEIMDRLLEELKVDAVFTVEVDKSENSQLITFENFPFGEIEVIKFDEVSGEPLSGAHFRIEGYFAEGNTNGMPIDTVQITGGDGKTVFKDLPAGQYTITEIEAPPGYQLDSTEFRSVSITWGQSATTTFYNKPKTNIEITKVDANDGTKLLEGATFELTDPTNGRTWIGTTGADGKVVIGTGSDGNELYGNKTYILKEIKAPNGYILDSTAREVVLKNIGENEFLIENWHNPSLTIVKRDKNNGQGRLEGAVFEINYENGQTVTGSPFTTDSKGEIVIDEILFDNTDERTLIITEIVPPDGYNLSDPNWQRVTVRKGEDNVVVFENTRKPTLEIHKVDATTGQNLAGAEFTIEKLEEPGKGMLTGNPFTTDANGKITLDYQYSGKYRIVEISAPNNYWLDPLQQNREWIIEILDNEDYYLRVENTLLPTLIITKWNYVTYKPVPLTHFKVEYETPNSSNVEYVGSFVTNENGQIVLPYVPVGWYIVTETKAAPGMSLATNNTYRVYLGAGYNSYMPIPEVTQNYPGLNGEMPIFSDIKVFGGNDFFVSSSSGVNTYNYPDDTLVIIGDSGETFSVNNVTNSASAVLLRSQVQIISNSTEVGEFSADSSGILVLADLQAAQYEVTRANGESQTIELYGDGLVSTLDFRSGDESGESGEGGSGTDPETPSEENTTNSITEDELENLDLETLETVENEALAEIISRNATVTSGDTYWNTGEGIWNYPLNSIVIKKSDATNGQLLEGATFELVYVSSGESGTKGTVIGRYTTNFSGIIVITGLEPGAYVVEEVLPPTNYLLSVNNRQTVYLKADGHSIVEAEFSNYPYGSLLIKKTDAITGAPLADAIFRVQTSDGTLVGTGNGLFTTNAQGEILIPNIAPDSYVVTETQAPNGYIIGTNSSKTISVKPDGQVYHLSFTNQPLSSLTVRKLDSYDNTPIAGAKFRVEYQDGSYIGEYETDQQGLFLINGILGWVKVIEIDPASGYVMNDTMQMVEVKSGEPAVLVFYNARKGGLTIEKLDTSGVPLAGAQFRVTKQNGEFVGTYTSNVSGLVNVGQLDSGWYVVEEIKAPDGYAISESAKSVEIVANAQATVTFVNERLSNFAIQKIDGDTSEPLSGVVFEITTLEGENVRNPQNNSFEFVTDSAGMIRLPELAEGSYVATETKPLSGYAPAQPEIFVIENDKDYIVTIRNYKLPDYNLLKIDGSTNEPLQGVDFELAYYYANGRIGEKIRNPQDGSYTWTTDSAGLVRIPNLDYGTYIATEIKPLDGYKPTDPQIFIVGDNQPTTITVRNYRYSEWNILKLDGNTEKPLQGVIFEVAHYFGDGSTGDKLRNSITGSFEFTTDANGLVRLGVLEPGTYIATEIKSLSGYKAADPVVFVVSETDTNTTITIRNYKQAELTVQKVSSTTRRPLQGVVFQISMPSGEKVVNPSTGNYDFKTDSNGLIYLSTINDGTYYLAETKAQSGYIALEEPIMFTVNSETRQREHLLVVENTPASGLLLIKTDAQTKEPLAGVTFEVRRPDGQLVQGAALDGNQSDTAANSPQLNAENTFTTNNRGRINLNHLEPGVYHVTEKKALDGYVLDTTVHTVTVTAGKQAVLEVENVPLAGFRIHKTDAVTGEPIFGVEFMLFDQNNKVVGNFYSDNRGIVEFPALLVAGRYTIRETRPAEGYAADDMPRTVDFVPGKVTIIEWTNVPIGGQIHISKVSGDYNEQNALPVGTPLQGAIFEIYSYRTGNIVDRIISDHRGLAVSKPLPLGRYYAQEVQSPAYYKINPTTIDFEIEFDRQIVKTMFANFSANIGVSIDKTGPTETMQGHNIFYDIKTVRNDSAVALTDFFWRDILPTNAVRADKLVTGTYNISLKYKVLGKTNKGNEIVIADNLSTIQNNVVELKPVHLGFATDEYLTEFTLYFGQVPAGFTAVDKPRIYVDVLSENHTLLPNGMMLANKVDVGGKVAGSNEWVISNSTAATTIYSNKKIPQSGY